MRTTVCQNHEAINRLRIERGLTWTALVKSIGSSEVTRARIRQGKPLSLSTFRRLAGFFDVPVSEIVDVDASVAAENSAPAAADGVADAPMRKSACA